MLEALWALMLLIASLMGVAQRAEPFTCTAYQGAEFGSDGITRTGTRVHWGTIAVDPRVIPLGSRVYILGMGEFTAEDTGSAIKGNDIDIWYPTLTEAQQFGRQTCWAIVDR